MYFDMDVLPNSLGQMAYLTDNDAKPAFLIVSGLSHQTPWNMFIFEPN